MRRWINLNDGIIPQWYRKYKGKILSIEETQELIEKIKQSSFYANTALATTHYHTEPVVKLTELIGDNQE